MLFRSHPAAFRRRLLIQLDGLFGLFPLELEEVFSGKKVKPDMRGIDRNRKGANHASSRQYPVDHSWRVGHRNRMGIGGTDSMHLHHRHPARHSSVQDGQACALAIRSGNRQPVDSKYYKAAKATLDEVVTDVNNWIDQQAAKAE